MVERRYQNLNATVLKQISKALEHDSAADIEPVLKKVCSLYAKVRQHIGERQSKQQTASEDVQEKRDCTVMKHKASYPAALSAFESFIRSERMEDKPLLCPLPHSIVFLLSPVVLELLGITAEQEPDLSTVVLKFVLSGAPIWQQSSRAVVQIAENVVVKVTQGLDHDEHGVLQYLKEHVPNVSAPCPLGLMTIGHTSFMFMSKIPGATLETRWPSLSAEAKAHIRSLLNQQLTHLRTLILPHGFPLGSPTGRCLCKDVRRDDRVSASPLYSESQFNDFLLDVPTSRASSSHKKWLHSMLRADHSIVFTHADFHPRNIMVIEGPEGAVELSGILDWESSGFYPEYWEHLKAMNTRSVRDNSDWWDYLPPCILGYDHEAMLDRVIESTVIY